MSTVCPQYPRGPTSCNLLRGNSLRLACCAHGPSSSPAHSAAPPAPPSGSPERENASPVPIKAILARFLRLIVDNTHNYLHAEGDSLMFHPLLQAPAPSAGQQNPISVCMITHREPICLSAVPSQLIMTANADKMMAIKPRSGC